MATLDDINTLPDARFLTLDDKLVIAEQDDRRSPKKISVGQLTTLMELGNPARGQISIQNNSTATDVTVAGTFYEAGINGTLDATTAVNFTANTNSTFGMKYTGTDTRIFWIYGSFDCSNGNNEVLAIRMAKNGTTIPATECRAFTGSNQNEAKLVTTWMLSLATDDVVTLLVANVDHTADVTVKRGRLVANAIS
jgi:hypothetical protein